MLRALLLGVLAVAAGSCGSKDAPVAADTAVAGKVIEVSGAVTVRGKRLATGDAVAADDVIETGADGRAVIELAHNGARWQLGPGKREKVTESIAWTLPKRTGETKVVDQDTAAAGRPAERSAAETSATSPVGRADDRAPGPGATAPSVEAPAPPAPPAASASKGEPPPPPPPAVQPDVRSVAGATVAPPAKTAAPARKAEVSSSTNHVFELLAPHRDELMKCMGGEAAFTIHIAEDGSATASLRGKATGAQNECIAGVLAKIVFPHHKLDASVDFN